MENKISPLETFSEGLTSHFTDSCCGKCPIISEPYSWSTSMTDFCVANCQIPFNGVIYGKKWTVLQECVYVLHRNCSACVGWIMSNISSWYFAFQKSMKFLFVLFLNVLSVMLKQHFAISVWWDLSWWGWFVKTHAPLEWTALVLLRLIAVCVCVRFLFSSGQVDAVMPFGCLALRDGRTYNSLSDVTDKYEIGQVLKAWVCIVLPL